MFREAKHLVSIAIFILVISCEKDTVFTSQDPLEGIWISVISHDTLFFLDHDTFERSFEDGLMHTYQYNLITDSIVIHYSGPNEILVLPTTHYFYRDNITMVIDFTNGCYGFDRRHEVYFKDES